MEADTSPRRARELKGLAQLALDDPTETIESALQAAREGLEMEIAYLAEFTDDEQIFHTFAGDLDTLDIGEGSAIPLADSYCQRMCDGRIGNVVGDVQEEPQLASLALPGRASIRAYVGVPLRFSDGRLYGTFCCLSHAPDPDIGDREVRFMRVLARIVAGAPLRPGRASSSARSCPGSPTTSRTTSSRSSHTSCARRWRRSSPTSRC